MARSQRKQVIHHLVDTLLTGPWQEQALLERVRSVLTERHPWLAQLIADLLQNFPSRRPSPWALRTFISNSAVFQDVWTDKARRPRISGFLCEPAAMEAPISALSHLPLPQLATPADLAVWLDLSFGQLDWFVDPFGLQGRMKEGATHHYVYHWHQKREGPPRLIESPKSRLKAIQREILQKILDPVPLHAAAHGFCKGRSCRSYVAPHAEKEVVIRFDLQDFFPSIPSGRVHAVFRSLGYPWETARLLTGLCTHTAIDLFRDLPAHERHPWQVRQKYLQPHLPQGAPTSPALANLCAFRLDCRLSGLPRSLDSDYTRYGDDLAFSGGQELLRKSEWLQVTVGSIALEEGFQLNMRKTKVMRKGRRQQLAGLVVNSGANIPRSDYDQLKAILHNCVRFGPQSQNRSGHEDFKSHLAGKLAWVNSVNPARGQRLRALFSQIEWEV